MSETTTHDAGMASVDTTIAADTDTETTAPTAEASTPEPETEAAETETQADPAASDTEQPPAEDAQKRRPWWEARLAASAFAEREAKREAAVERDARIAMEARLAALNSGAAPEPTNQQHPIGYVPATEVDRRAAEMAADTRFVETCNEIYEAAKSSNKDFAAVERNYALLTGNAPLPASFAQAVVALGKEDGARVYNELGKNPEEAARVLALPPLQMGVAVAKLAMTKPPAAPVAPASKAPSPIEPIGSSRARGNAEPDAAKNPAEWTSWFRKELASRR